MEITSKLYGDTLCVSLKGELDEHYAIYTRNSTGVGVLIGRYKKLKSKNQQIYITNPSTHAEKIFLMSGIYQIMPKID